jgi:hypothetical protein
VPIFLTLSSPYRGPKPHSYPNPPNPVNCAYYTGSKIPPPPPSSSSAGVQARDPEPARCRTTTTTVPVEYLCIETDIGDPPAVRTHKKGVLTTSVPDFCTTPPKRSTGEVPPGDLVFPLYYPYFAQTAVECCVYCSEQYYNLVASGFIKSALECECLVNNGTNYSGKSKSCPRGIQPYSFGKHDGHALPGPCFKEA